MIAYDIKKYTISSNSTVFETIKSLDALSGTVAMVLFVLDGNDNIVGSVTDGDVRRGLIKGVSLNDNVEKVMTKSFYFLNSSNINLKDLHELREKNIKLVPLLNEDKTIDGIVDLTIIRSILPLTCVIMAGGKGIRLRPYTDTTPKPLLMLEDKPIIVHNIDRLRLYGVKNFYISVNHMKEQIKDYLDNYYKNQDVSIKYIEEEMPLGTLGSIGLVKEFLHDDILVLNADLLTNIDFEDFYRTYLEEENAMSVATFNVKVDIPYAVLETKNNKISSLVEKPTYIYYSNAGIYLFKKEYVKLIPQNKVYDAIDLMDNLIAMGKNVTHYAIRGYWLDIGKPDNYQKAKDDIGHIKF